MIKMVNFMTRFSNPLKICLLVLCLSLSSSATGTPQDRGANFFMKEIILDRGKFGRTAKVDDADFEWLNSFRWRSVQFENTHLFYAVRTLLKHETDKKRGISMHRQIMGVTNPKIHVDHKDRDGLNNQRSNLRLCEIWQNNSNRISQPNTTSKYLGVCFAKNKWIASISSNNKSRIIGRFKTEIDAALAYNKRAFELRGEFASLNKIE